MSLKTEKKLATYLTILGFILMFASSVVFDILAIHVHPVFYKGINFFYSRNTLLTLSAAIGVFILFKNLHLGNNKGINRIASLTFGIYLIHENIFMRPFLWQKLFNNAPYENSPFLIVHLLFSVITVFIVCGLIEFIRQSLIERPLDRKLKSSCDKLSAKACNLFNRIYNKLETAAHQKI